MKKSSAFFTVAIIVAIVMLLVGIYYLIPHIWHPFLYLHGTFMFVNNAAVNFNAHKKYTAVFFAIAALALLCAFFLRQKKMRYS
jgi:hypothetical protein